MTAALPEALPYGVRDVKLTPYADSAGTMLGNESFDLPNMQTFSFSETEEFQELRGDDRIVTTRGKGAQVEWELDAGGISPKCWSIFTGGEIIESGTAPNRKVTLRKRGSDTRPYFRVDGQIISDSGGDLRVSVYRCRCNDKIEGDFADGEFFVTKASGVGLPLLDDANDLLYDIVQNETKTSIPKTPVPNPIPSPQNVEVGALTATSAELSWDEVVGATGYKVQKSSDAGATWTDVASGSGGEPSTNSTTVTTLTTATAYQFRVKAITASGESAFSTATGTITTP